MKEESKQQILKSHTDSLTKHNDTDNEIENVCPQCNHTNDAEAIYCEECAVALKEPDNCPHCGAKTILGADVCEVCSKWLLEGQCMFCYSYLEDNEDYCGNCGNPATGLTCPRCGNSSIFDFCKTCNIPLSSQAKEMVLESSQKPELQEMASLFKQAFHGSTSTTSHKTSSTFNATETETPTKKQLQDDQLSRLKSYRDSVKSQRKSTTKKATKAIFTNDHNVAVDQLNKQVAQEKERQRREEDFQHQAVEQLKQVMRSLGGKTFSSNQEARRFFMNLIAGLPEQVAEEIINSGMKWRCNCCGVEHGSPGDCSGTSQGGVWLV